MKPTLISPSPGFLKTNPPPHQGRRKRRGRFSRGWSTSTRLLTLALLYCVAWGQTRALGETTRSQMIQLRPGWNAVFLEVEPLERRPGELFAGTPVEVVAAFFPQIHPMTYIQNPGDAPWREEGWNVWYAPRREDGFLANLHTIQGNQAYLIFASAGFDWTVRGAVSVRSIRWQPNSYNFTGFNLDPQSPPTFEKFFSPSAAHRGQKIYRLADGIWSPVRDLSTTRMQAGAAYWVYCSGSSSYQGPLELRLSAGEQLDLGSVSRDGRIELRNASGQPTRLVIESMSGPGPLPLAYVLQDLSSLRTTFPPLPGRLELAPIAAGSSRFLRLAAVREQMTAARQSTLLRINSGEGVELWLPVVAERAP